MCRVNTKAREVAQRGFTIVEVMIAVAVMSLMLVSILKVLSAVRLTRDRIHNTQETQLAGPIIMDLIMEDLLGVHVLGRAKADHLRIVDRVRYGLDSDQLHFVTTTSSREPILIEGKIRRAQVCEVSYLAKENPEDDEFLELYRREDYGVDDEPYEGGNYTFLSNRVKSFSIEIFENDGQDEQPIMEWSTDTSSDPETQGLPASIVISLTLENTPRLLAEQVEFNSQQLMTVTYQRTIRFPEFLRKTEDQLAYLAIPNIPDDAPGGDADGSTDDEGGDAEAGREGGVRGLEGRTGDDRGQDRGSERTQTTTVDSNGTVTTTSNKDS